MLTKPGNTCAILIDGVNALSPITRERIGCDFDPRNVLLSLQIVFSFVRSAVAYASLKKIAD